MAPKRKGLGRGLDALIPNKINNTSAGSEEKAAKKAQTKKSAEVPADIESDRTVELNIPEQNAEAAISDHILAKLRKIQIMSLKKSFR